MALSSFFLRDNSYLEGTAERAFTCCQNTLKILERIGLADYFDAVADGNCITYSKPHPEEFLKAAEMIGLLPGDCVVVEDANAGVQAACAGGFECAAIGDVRTNKKAKWHLNHFSELLCID